MANGQQTRLPPLPLPGFDPASLLAQGAQSNIPLLPAPQRPGAGLGIPNLLDVPAGGIFDRRLPEGAIPGLGPLHPKNRKVGLFNRTGADIERVGEDMLDTAEVLTRSAGVEWTKEVETDAREILQGPGGIDAVMNMVAKRAANSPEALKRLRQLEQERLDDRQAIMTAANEAKRLQARADQQFKRYGGMPIKQHNDLTLAYAEAQGGIDALDDMIFMNTPEEFRSERLPEGGAGIGLARLPSMGRDAQGRIRGAYRSREARLFNVVQKLIQAGVLTPGEIPQIEKFVTSFTSLTADWSQGERDVRLRGLRDWIVDKTQNLAEIIPGQNPFTLDFSGRRTQASLLSILDMQALPEGFLLTQQPRDVPDTFAGTPAEEAVNIGLQNLFSNPTQ